MPLRADFPDIRTVPADLEVPATLAAAALPAPGKRVRQTLPAYAGTEVHHTLWLPTDWTPRRRYPVIVEYAGNGNYRNQFGDVSEGTVEGSRMGYGLSGGKGFIWLCLPYVSEDGKSNQIAWWGDAAATADYCRRAVEHVCASHGGDPARLILAGFSRGAIACNYIGLRDDAIARLWRAFIPYSHYDGPRRWQYADSDQESALTRLRRLNGRPQFIIHENSVEETQKWIASTGVEAPFTFRALNFRNHNDSWTLRDIPERREARAWLAKVLA